jgi:hypothetical protein
MKLFAPLLFALTATPFAMGLKADQLNEGSVLRRAKGHSDDDYEHTSGKGKGKGYHKTPPPPACETPAEKFYLYAEESPVFNLDYECPEGEKCVGAVIPFKSDLYLDHYFHYKAGYSIGYCILVANHPKNQYYCVFNTVIDYKEHKGDYCEYKGEIAYAGYGTPEGIYLITAANGAYKGDERVLEVKVKDADKKIFEYKLLFQGKDDGGRTDPPVDAPTKPPVDAPTEPPVDAPTEPPVDAPTEPPVDAPTEPPVDAPTEPPVDAPTEPPVDAPTDPPVDAPTEPPIDAPTEPPVDAPTEPPEPRSPYAIDFEFAPGFPDVALNAFTAAKARWEGVITTDVADVSSSDFIGSGERCFDDGPVLPPIIDDLYICSQVADLPGNVIGRAGPAVIRGFGGVGADDAPLTVVGVMTFDVGFLTDPRFVTVVLHEMAHVLGVGTLWTAPFSSPPLADSDTPPCAYADGTLASAVYQDISGCNEPIPIENDTGSPGSDCSHWAENCFGDELMTPTIASGLSNPLSEITIAGLEDLGYEVDRAAADPFSASDLNPACVCDGSGSAATTPTEVFTAEQESAYLEAWEYGMSVLLASKEGDTLSINEWISVIYLDPVTGDARSIIVRETDRP